MFFQSKTGAPITGNNQDCFSNFPTLPDGTQCNAMIKSFRKQSYLGDDSYQVVYQVVDGDFTGCQVKQTIRPFDNDVSKAQKGLNLMFRMFHLCNLPTDITEPPEDVFLSPAQGTILAIKIGSGMIGGDMRTWVREVYKTGELEVLNGQSKVVTTTPNHDSPGHAESALTRNNAAKALVDDDVPY